jgi:hypothetical protein
MSRATLLLLLLLPLPLPAQIDITVRWGVVGHGGHADAPTDDRPSMHPGIGDDLSAAMGFNSGGWRTALGLRRGTSDLVLVGEESGIITPGALRDLGLTVELGRVLVGAPRGPLLTLLATLSRHSWSFPRFGDPARTRWGAGIVVESGVPIVGRWVGVIRAELERSGSLFADDELPSDFVKRGAHRASLGVGLRWRAGGR